MTEFKFKEGDTVHLKGHSDHAKFVVKFRKVESYTLEGDEGPVELESRLYSHEGVGWFNETGLEKVS